MIGQEVGRQTAALLLREVPLFPLAFPHSRSS
jgi:hypothetical protein